MTKLPSIKEQRARIIRVLHENTFNVMSPTELSLLVSDHAGLLDWAERAREFVADTQDYFGACVGGCEFSGKQCLSHRAIELLAELPEE